MGANPAGGALRRPGSLPTLRRSPEPGSHELAKKSQVLRDQGRMKLIAKYGEARRAAEAPPGPEPLDGGEVRGAGAFAKLPRNSCPTRVTRRCRITGRSHAVYRKFGVSRIMLRELTLKGELPGMRKSSW